MNDRLRRLSCGVAPWLCLWLVACGTYGIEESHLLDEPLDESTVVPQRIDVAWARVRDELAANPSRKTLVSSDVDYVISAWEPIPEDASGLASLRDESLDGETGSIITTVRLKPLGASTRLWVRRVYYPHDTIGGIAHSTGEWELDFMKRIRGEEVRP